MLASVQDKLPKRCPAVDRRIVSNSCSISAQSIPTWQVGGAGDAQGKEQPATTRTMSSSMHAGEQRKVVRVVVAPRVVAVAPAHRPRGCVV